VSTNTTVVVVLTPHPQHFSAVLELLLEVTPAIQADPGCLLYAIHETPEGTIVLIERWASPEAWKNHFSLPEIMRLKATLPPWLAAPAERLEMYEFQPLHEA
jgi:quinol monooxygenase YgiN